MSRQITEHSFADDESKLIFRKRFAYYENRDTAQGWYSLVELLAHNYMNLVSMARPQSLEKYKKILLDEINSAKKIVIFGCGYNGKTLLRHIRSLGKEVSCFFDNFNQAENYDGVPIKKPQATLDKPDENVIIIPDDIYADSMYNQLLELGISKDVISMLKVDHTLHIDGFLIYERYPEILTGAKSVLLRSESEFYMYLPLSGDYLISIMLSRAGLEFKGFAYQDAYDGHDVITSYVQENRIEFEKLKTICAANPNAVILCDSMNVQKLMGCGIAVEQIIPIITSYERQYFDDFVVPVCTSKHNVFVDAGAYDMDTSLRFINWCKGDIEQIFSFEPDTNNYIGCRSIIADNDKFADKINLINKGLWNCETNLVMTQMPIGSASFINEVRSENIKTQNLDSSDKIVIPCTTIDLAVRDTGCSFIKMDIEGAELKALEGARQTIINHTPILAISIYHNPEDIVTIPEFIMSINQNYDLFLRCYQMDYTEIVLYAIPK